MLSFYPKGSKFILFSLYGQQFPRYMPIFTIAIFGYETCPLVKVPEVAHIHSFYLRESKFSLFSLYRLRFPRYGPIFKIAIFGHETWPLAKVSEVEDILPLYHRGSKLSLLSLYMQRFPRYGRFSKLAYLGMILGHWPQSEKVHISCTLLCSLSAPRDEMSLFLLYGRRFP